MRSRNLLILDLQNHPFTHVPAHPFIVSRKESEVLIDVARLRNHTTGRYSSWDTSGRNADYWTLAAGETRILADIQGPGCITHIWMTQQDHYRECLLKITWDDA